MLSHMAMALPDTEVCLAAQIVIVVVLATLRHDPSSQRAIYELPALCKQS